MTVLRRAAVRRATPRRATPRRATVVVASLTLLVPALAACSSDDRAASSPTSSTPTDELAATRERLAGRYAHYDVVAYEGDAMKTLIISYGFTDYEVVDGALVSTDTFCFSEHRSDQPISVQMSDAATQAIRPVPVPVTVTVRSGRAGVARPETPTGIGVRLADPANDPLPTDPADPRIADDDRDGTPGVTARVTVSPELAGDIYLARREIFAYDVDEQADGTLTGSVRDRSEQLIIGATDPVFLTQAQWTQYPDPARSPIILKPVEGEWDCARLRSERDRLFPPTPEVDW